MKVIRKLVYGDAVEFKNGMEDELIPANNDKIVKAKATVPPEKISKLYPGYLKDDEDRITECLKDPATVRYITTHYSKGGEPFISVAVEEGNWIVIEKNNEKIVFKNKRELMKHYQHAFPDHIEKIIRDYYDQIHRQERQKYFQRVNYFKSLRK